MAGQKLLIVDGYNVIGRVSELAVGPGDDLENSRSRLALRVASWVREHPGFDAVIVFDGEPKAGGSREQRIAGIRCVFTPKPHAADEEIIRLVREARGGAAGKPMAATPAVTVVSDDNNVRNNSRAHGASVEPASFIMTRKARPSKSAVKGTADGKGLDAKAAAEINKEMKKKFGM